MVMAAKPDTRKRRFDEWNRTEVPFPEEQTLHQLFEQQVEKTPQSTAVISLDKHISYSELNERSNRLAHAIRSHYRIVQGQEILPDTLIGVCMNRGIGMIVATLGILKAGCAYVPLDPAYPDSRLRFMMEDARAAMVVTEQSLLAKMLFLSEGDFGVVSLDGGWDFISRFSAENPLPICTPRNLAYLIYTSGSSGRPKGVMIEHRGVVNLVQADRKIRKMKAGDQMLQFASINFDAATAEIYPPLSCGATLHITPEYLRRDPQQLFGYLSRNSITDATIPPALLQLFPREDIPSLKSLIVAGDVCDRETMKFWSSSPGRRLINAYGPTEGTVCATESIYEQNKNFNDIGGPIQNVKIYLLDPERRPVPVGQSGEIHIGGVGVARGYLNLPELTEERFIENPFVSEEERVSGRNLRLYTTGDMARWTESGSLEFLGRIDFQVKIRGFRVEPEEIEAALSSHGEVGLCAVVPFGQGVEKQLAAYYVPVPGLSPSVAGLRKHLEDRLPEYMIPAVFLELEEMPLSASGKVDHKALPAPGKADLTVQRRTATEYVSPSTPEEQEVAYILQSLMNVDRLGVHDNIFDLGAHSLMAARIASEMMKKFSCNVAIKDIFDNPTVAGLTHCILTREKEGGETVVIPRVFHRHHIPISFQQEQVWFLSKLAPDNLAYNSQFSVRMKGPLDKEALTQSLNAMVRRHEILRTTFHESSQGPIQKIHAPWKVPLPVTDLRHVPEAVREETAEKQLRQDLIHHFDYTRLPLVRWSLYRLGEEDHIFLHMEYHFIHDGWEIMVFLKELNILYNAYVEGVEPELPEQPIQFADYALWQRSYLSGRRLEEKVNYWAERVKGYPQIVNFPTDHPRPLVQSFHGDLIRFELDRDLYRRLREFSRSQRVTLFTTMYSAFAVFLSRYIRQRKFLVGTGNANRNFKETECLMGMLVNAVLLYSDLSDNPTFKELLRTTREDMIRDAEHYDTPFIKLVERLKAGHAPGRNPLFQVIFAFHDSAVPVLDFKDLQCKIVERYNGTAKNDMNVICIPRAEQHVADRNVSKEDEDITIMWEYNSALFDRASVEKMIVHYTALLDEIIRSPEKRVDDLELMPAEERAQILGELGGIHIGYDPEQTIHAAFGQQVRQHPDRVAVRHNRQSLTYRELHERSNQLAHGLRKISKEVHGVDFAPDVAVGLCVERSLDMVTAMLAILKAGGTYVPLAPNYPEQRLRYMMEDTGIRIVLTQSAFKEQLGFLADGQRSVIALDDPQNSFADLPVEDPENINSSRDTAYIIYTSGSTGKPKGVMIPHQAVCNLLVTLEKEVFGPRETVAQLANYAFDASIYEIWGALLSGSSLAVIDSAMISDLDRLQDCMAEYGISSAFFTTALFNAVVDCNVEIITRLRSVLFGGEAANVASVHRLLEEKPPSLKAFHVYGPTECTCYSTFCLLTDRHRERDSIPIGRPLYNYRTYVLDENLKILPLGVPGELFIGGDGLARGYLHRDDLTGERFIDNHLATAEERQAGRNTSLYRTGDLVRWLPDGSLEFLGRTDFQVKIRGFRIEPEEVEAAILKHPEVKQCVVVPWQQHLIAYWVPQNSELQLSQDDLKGYLSQRLPDFMIPDLFKQMAAFELTSNFKVDRSKLPEPGPEDFRTEAAEYVPPQTATQKVLAEIWKELLALEDISIHDDFFDLGGNSIMTVRMLSQVKKTLGADVNIAHMFSQPTIAALAAYIDGSGITAGKTTDNLSLALKDAAAEIDIPELTAAPAEKPAAILLTGVTGFLGPYLLDTLISATEAEISCLIRGRDEEDIRNRFAGTLAYYRKEHLLQNKRIRLLRGDLQAERLGLDSGQLAALAEGIDAIYHCGAFVHHVYDYKRLRKANVLGSLELLRLAASGRPKAFHFISTLGTASVRDPEGRLIEIDAADGPITTNGYTLSKWVVEKILQGAAAKGMRVNIFRPGNIMGDSVHGICPPEKNHALLLLKGCIQMQAAPDWQRWVEMTPVDVLSRAIVGLAAQPGRKGELRIFNMNNPLEISWLAYMEQVGKYGFPIEVVPDVVWREKHLRHIGETNAMFPIKEFYLKPRKDMLPRQWQLFSHWNAEEVQAELEKLDIEYPGDYAPYIKRILHYLQESGFLPKGE